VGWEKRRRDKVEEERERDRVLERVVYSFGWDKQISDDVTTVGMEYR